jgi:UPF0176 protein
MKNQGYEVLLYYKYVTLPNPGMVRNEQRSLCVSLGLKGRIIVGNEGINGTVEGTKDKTATYIAAMENSEHFSGISYKKSEGTGKAFPKLSVRFRPEIVTSGIKGINPLQVTGKYLSADELHNWFTTKKEFYVVDMRNDYEYASGHFENFIPSGMSNFFTLSEVLPRLEHLKGKKVVTVCTGGIRCEKASGFLIQNGFHDVYQLKDGIQSYLEKFPNQYFKGKLYVFDNRITIGFNTDDPSHEVVGKCDHCGISCDSYVNCEYDICHRHYICCVECKDTETGFAFCNGKCKKKYINEQENKKRQISRFANHPVRKSLQLDSF